MLESFHALKEEKRIRIINAAMQVFSKDSYSKASTDDIAAMAGISKGALFYHFRNKKELYCYLYEYSCGKIYAKVGELKVYEETDFFAQNIKIVEARVLTMMAYPYVYDFGMRAYYETDEAVAGEIRSINQRLLKDITSHFSQDTDTSSFRKGEDVEKAVKMLVWLSEGFMKERKMQGKMDLKAIQTEFTSYIEILKHGFYKH